MKKIERPEQSQNHNDQRPRKLRLQRETLRALTTDQLRMAAGGRSGPCSSAACMTTQ